MSNIEKRLMQTMDMILIRKKRIAIVKRQSLEKVNDSVNKRSIWGMLSSVGSSRNQESKYDIGGLHVCLSIFVSDVSQLKLEIEGLEELSRTLFLEVHENRNMLERIEWSKTWKGIYFNFLGYIFSGYCLWKIFIVSISH